MDLGQNKKNPQDGFVDITKIKVLSHFCGEQITWWPGKFLRASKKIEIMQQKFLHTFMKVFVSTEHV